MENMVDRLMRLEAAQRRAERSLRFWRGAALGFGLLSLTGGAFVADGRGELDLATVSGLVQRVTALEQTVARHDLVVRHFSPGSPRGDAAADAGDTDFTGDVTLTGNLYIVNGLGSTTTTNASGNLIVGYNETGNSSGDTRTGSHNVIVGSQNSFSSYGGLVAGSNNTISGQYASVSGQSNTASSIGATVSGGTQNTASNEYATVSGGYQNTASGLVASVSGGNGNKATGKFSSVSGGSQKTASGESESVSDERRP